MKKIITLLIVLSMAALVVCGADFPDMPNDWSTAALNAAVDNGLISGSDGYICPNDNLTRAEMAAIMVRAFGGAEKADISTFTDVNADEWYYDSMAIAVNMGLFNGDGNRLNPDDPILREEAFVVIARALSLDDVSTAVLESYLDGESVSDWARGSVSALLSARYINGNGDFLEPQNNITRAEFAQVMYNIFARYIKTPGTYADDIEGSVVVSSDGVTIKDCTVWGDVIIGDGVVIGAALDNVDVRGRIIFRGGNANTMSNIASNNVRIPCSGTVVNHDVYGTMPGGDDFDIVNYIAAAYPYGFVYDDGVLSVSDEPIIVYGDLSVPFDAFRYYYRASLSQYDGGNPEVWAAVKTEIPDEYAAMKDQLKAAVSSIAVQQCIACPIIAQDYELDLDEIYALAQADIDELAAIYAQYGIDMTQYMEQMGISGETLLTLQASSHITQAIAEMLAEDVDDDEIDAVIAENGYVRAQHILVETEEDAEAVLSALEEGADFMELVDEYNTDPGMSEDGYFFSDGEMVEAFENACKELEAGETSGIVESDYGYHIIRRLELTDDNRHTVATSIAYNTVGELIEARTEEIMGEVEYSDIYDIIEPANLH